ncbi:MAG: hypothetical protein M3077_01455 [Candidatus Dormibacteraeota bacterium]|nr:hypothetical protein [Candidatus Dormibacteraeota bacterium]
MATTVPVVWAAFREYSEVFIEWGASREQLVVSATDTGVNDSSFSIGFLRQWWFEDWLIFLDCSLQLESDDRSRALGLQMISSDDYPSRKEFFAAVELSEWFELAARRPVRHFFLDAETG